MKENELRKKAEEIIYTDEDDLQGYDKHELRKIVHELQVHQIELELQNDELRRSEELLTESRRKYSDLYDFSPTGYLSLDDKGVIREANLTSSLILELERQFIIGKPFTLFIGALQSEQFYQYLNRIQINAKKQIWSTYITTTKNHRKFLRLETTFFRDKNSGRINYRMILSDITEMKQIEEELELTKIKLDMSLTAGNIAWWVWDYSSGHVDYSDLRAEMLGYAPEEFGHDIKQICSYIHPDDYNLTMNVMKNYLEGRTGIYETEYRIRKKDGDYLWFYDRGNVAERDNSGNPLKITGVVFDITERKKYEGVLKFEEMRLRQLADAATEGILFHDDGIIVDINKSLLTLLGYNDSSELFGQNVFNYIDPVYHEMVKETMQKDYTDAIEIELINQDERIPVELKGRPFEYAGKTIRVAAIRDIREQQENEAKIMNLVNDLEKSNFELEQSLERIRKIQKQIVAQEKMASLGMIAAGIAHEVKNPLNFINNFADLNQSIIDEMENQLNAFITDQTELLDEFRQSVNDLKKNTEIISRQGNKANDVIQSMLSQVRTGEVEWTPTDLNYLISEFFHLTYHSWSVSHPELKVNYELDLDESIGKITLIAQDISRVIVNLINNSFYAMLEKQKSAPEYQPQLNLITEKKADKVIIRIRDNGIGIESSILPDIFNPFYTTKPAGEGTGLGLSTSYDIIVNEHRGAIQAESVAGEFTEMIIELPLGMI